MTKNSSNLTLTLILLTISLILFSTFIIQHWLGHVPCKLCLYERIPYFISILLIAVILFTERYKKIILLTLSIVFLTSAALAFYHFGIEQGFFDESLACTSGDLSKTLSKEELLEQLKQNTISCKDASFRILGLSLAAVNMVFSFILSAIFIKLFLNHEKN